MRSLPFTPTPEHFHHLADRHKKTLNELERTASTYEQFKEKVAQYGHRALGTAERFAGLFAGGMIEGRFDNPAVGPIPVNLLAGLALIGAGHMPVLGEAGDHVNNVGEGLVGSYVAAAAYAFAKRWRVSGKLLGSGGHPWRDPYGTASAPAVQGGYSPDEMTAIMQKMAAAAAAPHGG